MNGVQSSGIGGPFGREVSHHYRTISAALAAEQNAPQFVEEGERRRRRVHAPDPFTGRAGVGLAEFRARPPGPVAGRAAERQPAARAGVVLVELRAPAQPAPRVAGTVTPYARHRPLAGRR